MQIDRESLNRLLSLGDVQLKYVINKLAAENGVDLAALNVRPDDVEGARRVLAAATDEDLERIAAQIEAARTARGTRGMRG